jgi:hypothetical protein
MLSLLFFQRLNKEVLDTYGVSWRCIDHLPDTKKLMRIENLKGHKKINSVVKSQIVTEHIGYKRLISGTISGSLSWGWKDPRTTLIMPLWKKIFPSSRVIHIYRDGRDCAVSLLKREFSNIRTESLSLQDKYQKRKLMKDFELWESYVSRALESSAYFQEHINVCYESLLKSPEKTIEEVLDHVGIYNKNAKKISSIVDNDNIKKRYSEINKKARKIIRSSHWLEELDYA